MHPAKREMLGSGYSKPKVVGVRSPTASWQGCLSREVRTPLRSYHDVTGARWIISTNSRAILATARDFFPSACEPQMLPALRLNLWVDPSVRGSPPWPQPFFRGLGHVVYAGFDNQNSFLLDLRRRIVLGRFSAALAGDSDYWERVILPVLVGLASDALGVTVIHCACVERDGAGLLLAGDSGAGKSTLSLALARCGFAFLSDDWTYLSYARRQLAAWGLPTRLKLLPDAVRYFPELRGFDPSISLNGETAFEVDPEHVFGMRRCLRCDPRWLVFLERRNQPGHALVRMPPQAAAMRLGSAQGRLPPELSQLRKTQRATIQSLVERECWLLQYGDEPEAVAELLNGLCTVSQPNVSRRLPVTKRPLFVRRGPNPTGRLTPTPFVADLFTGTCAVRLETNCPLILRLVRNSLSRTPCDQPVLQRFLWRLVSTEEAGLEAPTTRSSSVSAHGIQFVNMGQQSFLAMDAETRCAVGFLAQAYLRDERCFEHAVVARLLSFMTAALRWRLGPSPHSKRPYSARPSKG